MTDSGIQLSKNIKIPYGELDLSFSRSGGAGGQNVNKVNSKVTLRWVIDENTTVPAEVRQRFKQKFYNRINSEGEVIISSEVSRDQKSNIQSCYDKLAEMLKTVLVRPRKRIATKPSRSARESRLEKKKKRSIHKKNRLKPRSLGD